MNCYASDHVCLCFQGSSGLRVENLHRVDLGRVGSGYGPNGGCSCAPGDFCRVPHPGGGCVQRVVCLGCGFDCDCGSDCGYATGCDRCCSFGFGCGCGCGCGCRGGIDCDCGKHFVRGYGCGCECQTLGSRNATRNNGVDHDPPTGWTRETAAFASVRATSAQAS